VSLSALREKTAVIHMATSTAFSFLRRAAVSRVVGELQAVWRSSRTISPPEIRMDTESTTMPSRSHAVDGSRHFFRPWATPCLVLSWYQLSSLDPIPHVEVVKAHTRQPRRRGRQARGDGLRASLECTRMRRTWRPRQSCCKMVRRPIKRYLVVPSLHVLLRQKVALVHAMHKLGDRRQREVDRVD